MDNFRYTNEICPVCGKPFELQDDIVVCPLCGTPHHRVCYKNNGECGNSEKHNEGFVWEPTEKEEAPKASIDDNDNKAFSQKPTFLAPDIGNSPNAIYNPLSAFPKELEDGVSTEDVAISTSKGYLTYLKKFFLAKAGKKTFNWAAFIFGAFWFIYRKMYKLGACLLVVTLLLSSIPMFIPQSAKYIDEYYTARDNLSNATTTEEVEQISDDLFASAKKNPVGVAISVVFSVLQFAFSIYLGFIADKKYKEHIVKNIKAVNSKPDVNSEEMCKILIKSLGGTNLGIAALSFIGIQTVSMLLSYLADSIILK